MNPTRFPCPARRRVPLADRTHFRMGGAVEWLVEPRTVEEMAAALRRLREEGVTVRILGKGANLLVDDRGLEGAVLVTDRLDRIVRSGEDSFWIECGRSIQSFVHLTKEQGLQGAECLVGVPGSLGGAVAMNAGGRHGEIRDIVRRVRVLDPEGEIQEFAPGPEAFSYRSSIFGPDLPVLAVELALAKASPRAVEQRVRSILKAKARAQPLTEPSAGCAFKNPRGRSAGLLLEEAGVKGWRVGDAQVSEKHANFVVNRGEARLKDVLALLERMREAVRERHGVELEREVKVWSREPPGA